MELTLNGMEFALKSGGNTILEYRKDKPMVYVGYERNPWICTAATLKSRTTSWSGGPFA